MVQGGVGCQRGTTLDSSIPCEGNKVKKILIFKIYQSDFLVFFSPFFPLKYYETLLTYWIQKRCKKYVHTLNSPH